MSRADISKSSGLAESTVARISKLDQWDGLSLRVIDAFSTGCGVDLLAPGKHLEFLRRHRMTFLARANGPQRKMYGRILRSNLNHQ